MRLLFAVVLVLMPVRAAAWEQYLTAGGTPVRWFEAELELGVSRVVPVALGFDAAFATVSAGLEAWAGAGCDAPTVTAVQRAEAALDPDDRASNVVWFEDVAAWNARFSSTELARTILIHRTQSGALVDADIAVNLGGFDISASETCVVDRYDLRSTLTHEIGHFYGLDHSDVEGATMERRSVAGDCSMRTLEADDIAGLCATYERAEPAEVEATPEPGPEPVPEPVETAERVEPQPPADEGCHSATSSLSALVTFLALLILRARASARASIRRARRASG